MVWIIRGCRVELQFDRLFCGGFSLSHGSVYQDRAPQDRAPQGRAPQDRAPQDRAAHDRAYKIRGSDWCFSRAFCFPPRFRLLSGIYFCSAGRWVT